MENGGAADLCSVAGANMKVGDFTSPRWLCPSRQIKAGETAAVIARELAEQTKTNLQPGDITYTVKAMVQLVDLLDVQLRNLTPGGKDSAARSLNKVLSSAFITEKNICILLNN